jgi:hypothetical protein
MTLVALARHLAVACVHVMFHGFFSFERNLHFSIFFAVQEY